LFQLLAAIFGTIGQKLYYSTNMQNKPNLLDAQMNLSSVLTTDYENKSNWTLGENKPNSNPIKPNFRKAQNERKRFFTKGL